MIFDPLYLLVMGVGMALSLWASAKTKGAFREFSQYTTRSGMTGAQVAQRILEDNGIHDVRIEPVAGTLSDHYDPTNKVLRLSEPVYGSRSMSAFGVAAHEVGHAIQHAQGYAPLGFRSAWVPVVNFGSGASTILLILAFFMGGAHAGIATSGGVLALVAVGVFSLTTIFTLITLPVEFDASRRALVALEQGGYATPDELRGAKKVLDAAAMTYVAAFITSLLTMLYWAFRLGLLGGRQRG